MMNGGRFFISLIFLAVAVSSAVPQNAKTEYQKEFGAEIDVVRPVELPDGVFKQVLENGGGLFLDESPAQFRKRIVGTLIDLDGDKNPDFLVQGDNGANITGFWLFRNAGGRMRLVLHVRALGLWIGPKNSHGIKIVEAGAASASNYWGARYVFARGRYSPIKCWEEDLLTRKKRRFRCRLEEPMPYRET